METAGHRRTTVDVRDLLLCDRKSTDRFPLLFCFRGHWGGLDNTLVSPRRRGWESHVRRGKHMFVLSRSVLQFVSHPDALPAVLYASALAVYMHTVLPSESQTRVIV